MSAEHPVKLLKAEVARKIAAGEVIDRPNAIVRELMDNAIDSGADSITVEITQGGIEKVRVVDNGSGLTKEDLQSCARPHATSKITEEEDLLKISTLGFRGEALSSIAAVCRLSIVSSGYKMRASITEDHLIEPFTPLKGTIVQAEGLFENIPARRQFLKRPASEALQCKSTFIEKAIPHTKIAFRFIQDGEIKLDLPKNQTKTERFIQALEIKENPSLFSEISGSDIGSSPNWSFEAVIGEPGVFRNTKKDISIFVNGRKIQEYSLVQAIEYGSRGFFPNGTFPVAQAYITVNPSLIDFNIHPAKKEARFKDIAPIHHAISSAVRAFYESYTNSTMKNVEYKIKNEALTLESPTSPQNVGVYNPPHESNATLFSPEKLAESALNAFAFNATKNDFSQNTSKNNFSSSQMSGAEGPSPHEVKQTELRSRFFQSSSISSWNAYASKEASIYKGANIPKPEKKLTESLFSVQPVQEEQEEQNLSSRTQDIKKFVQNAINAYNKTEEETTNKDDASNLPDNFHFIGSALGTFLIAEKNNILYIIDKHAAHERSIFDEIMKERRKSQTLLLPYIIETESEKDDEYLKTIQNELSELGFTITQRGNGRWEVTSINERWTGTESELEKALLLNKVPPKEVLYSIAAMTACKAAVKDGTILEDAAAKEIAQKALLLPDPHCPHGRPCYTTITRENLFKLVRRTN